MADTEKITINLSVVDLGKIDLMIDQGFYSSRTDLIRTAIREKLATHSRVVEEAIIKKSAGIGIMHYSKKDLEKFLETGEKKSITVVGLFSLGNEITPELARETIESIRVYGVFQASSKVKDALKDRIK
ncbi:MAG: hypothetical protein JEZ06_12460 [Anaerolineaceae bacterium]|nr:hypothetical protein [Anaerolineaceae bacterium]